MKTRTLLLLAVFSMLAVGLAGHANPGDQTVTASTCNGQTVCQITDLGGQTLEPILTRSSAAPVYADCGRHPGCTVANFPTNTLRNQSANVKKLTLSAGAGKITAQIQVGATLVKSLGGVTSMAPYSGQHVLVMFQTEMFQQNQQTGVDAAGLPTFWGPPGYNADGFRWFLYWGWNATENREVCGLGYYDPTGELVPPAPVFFGQTFFVVGQRNSTNRYNPNTTCSASGSTVTITQPYTYTYGATAGQFPRSVKIININGSAGLRKINNITAFTWMDHEAGGPDPVGLIIGWTWYTDSLPWESYKPGVIAGDPNPFAVAGPKCYTNEIGGDPVTGPPGPCLVANPVGPGFVTNNLNVVATS